MTHVDPAALKPAKTGMRSAPVTGPVSPAATVPPAWSYLRVTALNPQLALGDDPHDSYKSKELLESQTRDEANKTVQDSDTHRLRLRPAPLSVALETQDPPLAL